MLYIDYKTKVYPVIVLVALAFSVIWYFVAPAPEFGKPDAKYVGFIFGGGISALLFPWLFGTVFYNLFEDKRAEAAKANQELFEAVLEVAKTDLGQEILGSVLHDTIAERETQKAELDGIEIDTDIRRAELEQARANADKTRAEADEIRSGKTIAEADKLRAEAEERRAKAQKELAEARKGYAIAEQEVAKAEADKAHAEDIIHELHKARDTKKSK